MPLNTLEDLFVQELHDLHSAEKQLVDALPQLAEAAWSHRLRRRFEGQLVQSRHHVQQLEQILQHVDKSIGYPKAEADALEGTVDVLMPFFGEWVPVESSFKSPSRRQRTRRDNEQIGIRSGICSQAMEGLLVQGKKMIDEDATSHVKDAGLIAKMQQVEHYEIAGYGTARAHARLLGHIEAEQLLEQTLAEVKQTDEKLTEMAENDINAEALQVG